MINVNEKIVVVLGANGTLGSKFVKELNIHGGTAISADIDLTSDLENLTYQADITKESSIKELIDAVINKFGRIDGWINTAYPRTDDWGEKIDNIKFESWKKNVDMHMNGYFIASKLAIDAMLPNKKGSLINISSIYGTVAPDFSIYDGTNKTMPAAYSAIKGGINNISNYLASYYGKQGIRVNTISPGGIKDPGMPEKFIDTYNKKVPLNRMGTPEDIAPSVVFLLSDSSSYITGHNLIIDGGWTTI